MQLEAKAALRTPATAKLSLLLLSAIVALGLFAPQASAETYVHPLLFSFGPDGTAASKFRIPGSAAFNQKTHELLVADNTETKGKSALYRFTSSGAPSNFTEGPAAGTNKLTNLEWITAVAVAPAGAAGGTEGDIYVLARGKVRIYSEGGALLGEIDGSGNPFPPPKSEDAKGLNSLIVDQSGNVYVGWYSRAAGVDDSEETHIDKYVPAANPPTNADFDSQIIHFPQEICAVGTSATTLYAHVCEVFQSLLEYPLSAFPGGEGSADVAGIAASGPATASGDTVSAVTGSVALPFALDPVTFDYYVVNTIEKSPGGVADVEQYDKDGNLLARIILPQTTAGYAAFRPGGLALDEANGDLFVPVFANRPEDSTKRKIYVYGPGELVKPPTVTIDPVSGIGFESADFSGTINAGGTGEAQKTTYRFQCVPACPGLEGDREIPADGADHAVSDSAEGLTPGTKYEVTLVAENQAGKTDTVSFETKAKPSATPPQVTIGLPAQITATSAHLSGTVDPGGTGPNQATTYRFEYLEGLQWVPLPKQGPIEGSGAQEVSTDLTGLEPNTGYSVRLRAENLGGAATSPSPDPMFTTETVAPVAEATAATHVRTTSAQINARIQPHKLATTYYFQWGTGDCDAGGCASIPASEDGEAGEGDAFVFVKAQLEGLTPGTAYHYRLVAQSQAGETTTALEDFTTASVPGPCPNATLRGGASAILSDCRAYEMVSPLEKNGGDIAGMARRTRVATDGDAVSYLSFAAFAGTVGYPTNGAEYISRRGPGGWRTYPITPQIDAPPVPSYFADSQYVGDFSADLSRGIFRALVDVGGVDAPNVAHSANLFLGENLGSPDPSLQILSDSFKALPPDNTEFDPAYLPPIQFDDASDDFSHVLFESRRDLTADAGGEANKLYEWVEGQGLHLEGILPDDTCGSPPCVAPFSTAGGGTSLTEKGEGAFIQASNAISADGSRVFFTARASAPAANEIGPGDLYMREDGTTTVRIDASERTEPIPGNPGISEFQAATPDGSEAFFLSTRSLTDDDRDGNHQDLYRYDVEAPAGHHLTLMTPDRIAPDALRINYVPGISDDGSYVYIEGIKTGEPRLNGEGHLNASLFLLHDGEARFIGRRNAQSWGDHGTFDTKALRVSPDGSHVLFGSADDQGLGHNMNGTGCEDNFSTIYAGPCIELFLYDADSDELSCVSCDPSDAAPRGNGSFWKYLLGKGDSGQQYLSQPLTPDGRRVFFTSRDPLVPEDSNGKLDAYEYDTESGRLSLISSGQCNCDSVWVGASRSGDDVFFTTREQLVRADNDDLYDIYDARVNGGIASQNQLPPVPCEGDACQPVGRPPALKTPASAGFSGPGNQQPAKAHKHKRKRHAHKAKRAKRRHARNHGKRG